MEKQVVSSLWLVGHAVLAYYRNGSGPCTAHNYTIHRCTAHKYTIHRYKAHKHTVVVTQSHTFTVVVTQSHRDTGQRCNWGQTQTSWQAGSPYGRPRFKSLSYSSSSPRLHLQTQWCLTQPFIFSSTFYTNSSSTNNLNFCDLTFIAD